MRRPTLRVPADRVRTPADLTYRLVNGIGRTALAGLAVRTRWEGAEHVPTSGPVIIAANHVSYVDFVFLQRALRRRHRRVRFMTRADVWDAPGVGPVMDAMGHIPVDRDAPAAAYLRARSLLRQGHAVGVFPEAGISYSLTVRGLMRGVAALGRETGVPVVPAAIFGSQRIYGVWPLDEDGRELGLDRTRGRRVDVVFGEPVLVPPTADLTEWTRWLGERLTGMLEGLQGQPQHRPRPGEWAPWYPAHLGGDALTRAQAREWDVLPRSAVQPTWGPQDC
ncbi:MAG: lysophospholipid acyltransferase family protein [Nocardioides sp.]|uniref:lysophospholipid acyltransferase family protein n=1 Tax=Nocardioides sp. TaxID=35761 RepID=UPI003F0E162B